MPKCVKCDGTEGIFNVYKQGSYIHTAADDCERERNKPKVAVKASAAKEEPDKKDQHDKHAKGGK